MDTIELSSVGESKLVVMLILFGSAGRVPSVDGLYFGLRTRSMCLFATYDAISYGPVAWTWLL